MACIVMAYSIVEIGGALLSLRSFELRIEAAPGVMAVHALYMSTHTLHCLSWRTDPLCRHVHSCVCRHVCGNMCRHVCMSEIV